MVNANNKCKGFSLMELMVVMLILALLVSIVPPLINKSVSKAKEGALRENLSVMRKAIDAYYADHGQYPPELNELVNKHYIRSIPKDPVGENDWNITRNDAQNITDIHSGSNQEARDGSNYNEW